MPLTIHIDGGSRGNPGPAGAGVVIARDDGTPLLEAGFFLGRQTNNVAEYMALIRALEHVAPRRSDAIRIHSDSELLVKQITGEYRVKNPTLQELHGQVEKLLVMGGAWQIRHVRREHNRRADELANLAMDRGADVIEFAADGAAAGSEEGGENPPGGPAGSPPPGGASGAYGAQAPLPEVADELLPGADPAAPSPPVRVTVTRAPRSDECPAGAWCRTGFVVRDTLGAEACLHAAHAFLPTVLAIKNADAPEFNSVPPLTVRCSRNGCSAVFQVAPQSAGNGSH